MDGLEWTASALGAAERALDVATQNLAAAPCDGFHRLLFTAKLTAQGIRTDVSRDAQLGGLRRTGRALDLAVDGARFACLNGETRVTVCAQRTRDGHLSAQDGQLLRGQHGALRFPLQAEFRADGAVMLAGRQIDQLALTRPAHIEQGVVEASNGDSMQAMIAVLQAQRQFETAQKMTQSLDAVAAKDATEITRAAS